MLHPDFTPQRPFRVVIDATTLVSPVLRQYTPLISVIQSIRKLFTALEDLTMHLIVVRCDQSGMDAYKQCLLFLQEIPHSSLILSSGSLSAADALNTLLSMAEAWCLPQSLPVLIPHSIYRDRHGSFDDVSELLTILDIWIKSGLPFEEASVRHWRSQL